MPAFQTKINLDGKTQNDDDMVRVRGRLKARTKDRNCSRKSDPPWERLSQLKRRQNIVPELNLKNPSPRSQNKRNQSKDSSSRKSKNETLVTPRTRFTKKRQSKNGNDNLKSNMQQKIQKTDPDISTKEITQLPTFHSVAKVAKEQPPNVIEVENISPNQLPDSFYECNESDEFFRNQFPDFENSSEYGYHTPQLYEEFPLPTVAAARCGKHNSSTGVLRHFKELLQHEESSRTNLLAPSEIALLRDIVKSDERHQELRRDDYHLLKDILLGQLKELSQQERVIKIALKKIRCESDDDYEVTTIKVEAAEQPMEDSFQTPISINTATERSNSARSNKAGKNLAKVSPAPSHREEVDVIFKNVPSLEKEIRILRTLGLKLEETLKRSSKKNDFIKGKHHLIRHTAQLKYFLHWRGIASLRVISIGHQVITDVAQEFQIRHQTINELKLEREFFIPSDLDRFSLQRTNFHKLSRNPGLLLRRLKPFTKSSRLKFNFIEQDPMFFNHFLAKMCSICTDSVGGHDTYIPLTDEEQREDANKKIILIKSGAGDHPDFLFNKDCPLKLAVKPKTQISNRLLCQKKNKKQYSTPLPEGKLVMPKNTFLRTILLGTLQISIFITVLTAILYPDILCL